MVAGFHATYSSKLLFGCLESQWIRASAFFFVTLKLVPQSLQATSGFALAAFRLANSSRTIPFFASSFCCLFLIAFPPRGCLWWTKNSFFCCCVSCDGDEQENKTKAAESKSTKQQLLTPPSAKTGNNHRKKIRVISNLATIYLFRSVNIAPCPVKKYLPNCIIQRPPSGGG